MTQHIRSALLPVLLVAGSLLAACNDGDGDGDSNGGGAGDEALVADGPEPSAMCADGGVPVVAAYEADTGKFRWVACTEEQRRAAVHSATDDRVFVRVGIFPDPRFLGFDADSGDEVWRGTEAEYVQQLPDDADVLISEGPEVDGLRLSGGQDEPLVGLDGITGEQRWSHPDARLPYDDVWAVGDGAVFAVHRVRLVEGEGTTPGPFPGTNVVAYEISSGKVRWQRHTGGYLWPWHVRGDRLFVLWDNLEVADTADGRIVWKTAYAPTKSGFPRMTGAVASDELVFVSFAVVASGGD